MRIPSRQWRFAEDLHADPLEISAQVLQAHLIKHPFGMSALMTPRVGGGARRWNDDGWDALSPPVITLEQRRSLTASIGALVVDGASCQLSRLPKEEYGGEAPDRWEACPRCPTGLAEACKVVTYDAALAYRAVIDDTLALLAGIDGEVVARSVLRAHIPPFAKPDELVGAAIMTLGQVGHPAKTVARINRWDGVRVELYVGGRQLRWRTTYRRPASQQNPVTQLLDFPRDPADLRLPLSGKCIVSRPWWERITGVHP